MFTNVIDLFCVIAPITSITMNYGFFFHIQLYLKKLSKCLVTLLSTIHKTIPSQQHPCHITYKYRNTE